MARRPAPHNDTASAAPTAPIEVGSKVLIHTSTALNGSLVNDGEVVKLLDHPDRLVVDVALKEGGSKRLVATREPNPEDRFMPRWDFA